jgi:hypothetical protein
MKSERLRRKGGLPDSVTLSFYFDRLRFADVSVLSPLAAWFLFFTLFLAFDSSSRTAVALSAESTL